jgi:hypothetical protein
MTNPEPSQGARHWTGAAIALFVVGLLILVPSGLCSGLFLVGMLYSTLAEGGNFYEGLSVFGSVFLFGGPFIAVGLVLTVLGLRMRSRK